MSPLLTRTKFRLRLTGMVVMVLWFLAMVLQASSQPTASYVFFVAPLLLIPVYLHAWMTRLSYLPKRWPPRHRPKRIKWFG